MTRRFTDLSRPLPSWTAGDAISAGIAMLAGIIGIVIFLAFLSLLFAGHARAHDSWINHGNYKNNAGEWCCGDYDCKAYDKVESTAKGWMVDGEFVPFDEALPVAPPDGVLTICRRYDGTRRCVFGVKPSG